MVASVRGLDGLSIGALAADLGMSKSGLFAHFGSKEELQLAAIAAARDTFIGEVVETSRLRPPGLARLVALNDLYLRYSERRIFPAGCFFFGTTTEFSGREGAVHDEAASQMRSWLAMLADHVAFAVDAGELTPNTDVRALAFELGAFLTTANWMATALDAPGAYADARAAIADALAACGATPAQLRELKNAP